MNSIRNFFKKKMPLYTVCTKCSVHFSPSIHDKNEYYKSLCTYCKKPIIEIDKRKSIVTSYMETNWKEYEKEVLRKIKEKNKSRPLSAQLLGIRQANNSYSSCLEQPSFINQSSLNNIQGLGSLLA